MSKARAKKKNEQRDQVEGKKKGGRTDKQHKLEKGAACDRQCASYVLASYIVVSFAGSVELQ